MVVLINGGIQKMLVLFVRNPLMFAIKKNNIDLFYSSISFIKKKDSFVNSCLHELAKSNYFNGIEFVLNLMSRFPSEYDFLLFLNDERLTPIHIAALNNNFPLSFSTFWSLFKHED